MQSLFLTEMGLLGSQASTKKESSILYPAFEGDLHLKEFSLQTKLGVAILQNNRKFSNLIIIVQECLSEIPLLILLDSTPFYFHFLISVLYVYSEV